MSSREAAKSQRARHALPFPVVVAVLAARDHAAASGGLRVLLWSVPARAVLQTAFLTLLGRYAGGEAGRDYAFVGAVAFATTTALIVRVTDVIVEDRWQGTLYRLRLGRLPLWRIALLRSTVYLVEAMFAAVTGALGAGLALLGPGPTARVLAGLPFVAVMSISVLGVGLTVAAFAVGKSADVLLANGATYLVLVGAGVVVPVPDRAWLDAIGGVLPLRHGLAALHAWLAGGPWLAALLWEVVVAIGWLAVAAAVLAVQSVRARRTGFGEFG